MSDELIYFVLATPFIAGVLLFRYASLFRQKYSLLKWENNKLRNVLAGKTPEEAVAYYQNKTSEIKQKIKKGDEVHLSLLKFYAPLKGKLEMIDAGMLPAVFSISDDEALKQNIKQIQTEQLNFIKQGNATKSISKWTWFGSEADGQRMVNAYNSLLLKAYNAEFDAVRKKMRHSSIEDALYKLVSIEEQLGKLGETVHCDISHGYALLKRKELNIWHDNLVAKEQKKQERKEQQEYLRLQKEIGLEDYEELKDEIFYTEAELREAQRIAKSRAGMDSEGADEAIEELRKQLAKLEEKYDREISQAQITRAGYIYVISNVGSFGKNVLKIGMTRRLEPFDRVKELGDASVPYKFDVHTMAFTQNAPKIERLLHEKFSAKRVNSENTRKEFFKVSSQEIKLVMDALGVQSDWYFDSEAKEFNESNLMRNSAKNPQGEEKISAADFPQGV